MFSFYWPWFALLLPLPLVVGRLRIFSRRTADQASTRREAALLHPSLERVGAAFTPRPVSFVRTNGWRKTLLAILWVALVGCMMRPQWLAFHTEVETEGYDLLLAIDVSRSMEALDFTVDGRRVTRMSVIKGVVGRFIEGRNGDRIGLVLFGSHAYVISPLTLDVQAVRTLLDGVDTRVAGDGTAIGDAIGLGVKKLRERPPGSRVLVLVTDGENTMGSLPPRLAARLAADQGIRVYTIGVGSMGLVPFYENGELKQVHMELDEQLLGEIAEITGGTYFRATDTGALEQIYAHIDALEKTEGEVRSIMLPTPLYQWPLGVALFALLLLGLFPEGMRRVAFPRIGHG